MKPLSEIPYVDIHTHRFPAPEGVFSLYSCRFGTESLPGVGPYWCGVHPWDADRVLLECLDGLRSVPAAGIGEIGLDFLPGRPDRFLQTEWFERQLAVARERSLPVMLHLVRAHAEGLAMLDRYGKGIPAVIVHGFIGSPELAGEYVRRGGMLSFGERALRSLKTTEAFRRMPLSSLFLESDDRETDMPGLYAGFARLRGMTEEDLKERVFENYLKVFGNE